MSAATLQLEQVTRRFATQVAVDELTLAVAPGELLALLGASGSGKSTTLRLVAGFEQPDSGRLLLDGVEMTRVPPERRGFGMVFQQYALFPHLSVEDNVAFGLEARGVERAERRRRARVALAAVGLEAKASRAVQALSGGEQQRVALARATVIEPRVLLLDEPLSNLDPTLREAMRDDLRAMLRRSGATTLFVTHDQEDAFAVADRIALLAHGRLLQVGSPSELYHRPATRAVAEFIGRATLVRAAFSGTHAVIELGGRSQRVAAVAAGDWRGGEPALAVLRPESLALVPDDEHGAFGGDVIHARFSGGLMAYRVRCEGGIVVEVATADRSVDVGRRVGVRIAREPVTVVRE